MKSLFLTLLLLSLCAHAQEGNTQTPQTTPPPTEEKRPILAPTPETDITFSGDEHSGRVSFGPALAILKSEIGFGVAATLIFKIIRDVPLYVGIESGFYRWGGISTSSFPVLATLLYRLRIGESNVTPYMGVSAGVSITAVTAGISSTKAQFEGLGRVGVEFELDRQTAIFVEPKLGILDTSFVFLPTVGIVFSF